MGHAVRILPPAPELVDQIVVLHDVSWAGYEALLEMRGERSVPRITYCEGELELMTPSKTHEVYKKSLARVLEAWSHEVGLPLEGYGSWTIKEQKEERGAEPDECYVVARPGRDLKSLERPDFAIEVEWTRRAIDKLDVYRHLGVREVWIWKSGALTFHVLRGDEYEAASRSEVLPELDPALIVHAMEAETQHEAVARLHTLLRARR